MEDEQVAADAVAEAAATRDEGHDEEAGASGAEVGAGLLSVTQVVTCNQGHGSVTESYCRVLGSRGAGGATA